MFPCILSRRTPSTFSPGINSGSFSYQEIFFQSNYSVTQQHRYISHNMGQSMTAAMAANLQLEDKLLA
jgi:hypothetical protein